MSPPCHGGGWDSDVFDEPRAVELVEPWVRRNNGTRRVVGLLIQRGARFREQKQSMRNSKRELRRRV